MTSGYIHGGTDPREVARLERQGDWTAAFSFPRFTALPGERVLDLACGVGAMASRLVKTFPGIDVVGVDVSAAQLRASRQNHPSIPIARADGTRLPFADETFDRVHCTWLLEHVDQPAAVLRDVRRVLKRGGNCHFVEVDNWSFTTKPVQPEAHELLRLLNATQARAGGDPGIGPKLPRFLQAAQFRRFTLEPVLLVGTAARPTFFKDFVEEFTAIFDSVDEALGESARPLIVKAKAQLDSLLHTPGGELRYTAYIAQAWR